MEALTVWELKARLVVETQVFYLFQLARYVPLNTIFPPSTYYQVVWAETHEKQNTDVYVVVWFGVVHAHKVFHKRLFFNFASRSNNMLLAMRVDFQFSTLLFSFLLIPLKTIFVNHIVRNFPSTNLRNFQKCVTVKKKKDCLLFSWGSAFPTHLKTY